MGLRRAIIPLALAAALLLPAGAWAGQQLVIVGAGDGHGVGMSQTGAEGLALHGFGAAQILSHYYTGTTIGRIAPGRSVSVLLQSGLDGAVFTGATSAGSRPLGTGAVYLATADGTDEIALEDQHGHLLAHLPAPLFISGPAPLTLDGAAQNGVVDGRYRGRLELVVDGHSIEVIDVVGIEQYLRGVVGAESPPNWPVAELQAQAIAARSFAVAAQPQRGFDLYATTASQVYDGVAAETPQTDAAVAATRGEVVTYAGQPIEAYYFASSGGETEDIQNAFAGAAPEPYLQAVLDPFDTSRFGPITMTLQQAAAKLRGLLDGTLRAIDVLRRGVSPRIVTAEIVGSSGTTTVSGSQLAAALGLPSTWACFTVTASSGTPTPGWDAACQMHAGGATGPAGATGPTVGLGTSGGGAVGPVGTSGASGTSGANGASGASGTTGVSGPTGPTGTGTTTGGTEAP